MYRDRAPRKAAWTAAVILAGTAACSPGGNAMETHSPEPAPTTTSSRLGNATPPKTIATCHAFLDGFKKTGQNEDGDVFEVTSVEDIYGGGESTCAPIYDARTLTTFGGLAVGDPFVVPCHLKDKPVRLHISAPNSQGKVEGSVNISVDALSQLTGFPSIEDCVAQGVKDEGSFIASQPPSPVLTSPR